MTPTEHLHYALGMAAYAIAGIDGKVQTEERKKFHAIVEAEIRTKHPDFDISEIIFTILDKDKTDPQTAYEWAMKEVRLNSQYLDPELKNAFIRIVDKIAKAFPPVTVEEKKLADLFKADIAPIAGDPVYFYS